MAVLFVIVGVLFLQLLPSPSRADTEIINFFALESSVHDWNITEYEPFPIGEIIRPSDNTRTFTIHAAPRSHPLPLQDICNDLQHIGSCRHQLFLFLALDEEQTLLPPYPSYTLRVSWPGSSAVAFGVELLSPDTLASYFGRNETRLNVLSKSSRRVTRDKIARIRAKSLGVTVPPAGSHSSNSKAVEFNVILERLYFGVLPKSLMPTVVLLVPLAIFSFLLADRIGKWLANIANDAKAELRHPKD